MRKLRAMAAMLLALILSAGACAAEGQLASDLAGGFTGGEYSEDAGLSAPDQAINVLDADLLVGYVAQPGAAVNPFVCNEWDLVSMNQLVFESVVGLDENQKPTPLLADNWSQNGKYWTFNLRSGITFHNGEPLTAYDVKASFDRFIAAGRSNPYTMRMEQFVEEVQALDDRTLAVKSTTTSYLTLYAMTFPVVQATTVGDDMPRGTGPYWYVSYSINDAIRLEANPLWWKQAPTLKSVTFRYYQESGKAIEALQTHEVDMLSTRSTSAAICRKLSNLTAMDYGTTTYEMMVPNARSGKPLSDVYVRQAVMYAIDRSVIASNAYLDMAIQSEVPVLPGTWLYESQSAKYYYSPERALQMLHNAGWEDLTGDMVLNKLNGIRVEELEIDIVTYNDTGTTLRENAAYLIEDYLEAVGMRVNVSVLSKSKMKDALDDRDYDIALIGVNLSETPVLQPLLGTDGALNFSGYSNPMMDELILETAKVSDEEHMDLIYSQIQLKVVDELPIMGLLFRTGTVLSTRSMAGMNGIRALSTFRGMEYLAP